MNDDVDSALKRFDDEGFSDGDIVTHEWIQWALDLKVPTKVSEYPAYELMRMSRVEDFKTTLLERRKIALSSLRGKGYLITPPADQALLAAEEAIKHIKKGLVKADRLLTHARFELMTAEERKRHTDTRCRFDGIRGIMTRQKREVFALFDSKKVED